MAVGDVIARGYDEVRYSIYSGDPNGYFTIDAMKGTIRTAAMLDHETHPVILLNVQAMAGHPPSYGHTQVNITIEDVNDNLPQFESSQVKISVPENVDLTSPIYVAHARDPDSGDNGVVRYSLQSNPGGMFRISPRHGHLTLLKRLDYEESRHHTVIVEARDGGTPPLSTTLTIQLEVQDVNDNPPVFDRNVYRVNVSEELPANAQFLAVRATDRDTGNNARLTYRIRESGYGTVFGIFPNSGSLYLKERLDREHKDRYTLTVVATDNGSPVGTASTTVYIRVVDANDNAPIFSQDLYMFSVEEELPRGTPVGRLHATDADLGKNAEIVYRLYPTSGHFQINRQTGEISTMISLDREAKTLYEFTAEARDQGHPMKTSKCIVRINVTDVNDNSPVFVEPENTHVRVREEQPPGTEVVRVQATDRDEGENATVEYSFQPGKTSDGTDAFTIDSRTGVISTKSSLDHEEKSMYRLEVVAKDGGSPSQQSTMTVRVEVLDLNDNRPTFVSTSVTFQITEGIPVGQDIGTVLAVDKDDGENGRVTYTIISGNVYGVFDINRMTGTVFTTREVDHEMQSEYTLKIKAVDSSATNPKSNIISVKIEVLDVNDQAPVFETDPIMFSVSENTPIGTTVWNFTATDLDSGMNGVVHYAIVEQSPKASFSITPTTGALSLSAPLDYETHINYTLIIMATDQAKNKSERLSTSVTASIIIGDYNDNRPRFVSRDRVEVMEDEPPGYPVLHVIALDEDSRDNGRVTYIVTSGNEDGTFTLDYETGLLSVGRRLDRELNHHYVLNVTASDHGKPSLSASQLINIYIIDVNDNPPKFDQVMYRAFVMEDARPGTFVTRVSAHDSDLGANGNLTYSIPRFIADDKFTVNPYTGEIHTAGELDRETKSSYSITVYVKDGSLPPKYDTAVVYVELLDVNDHDPAFPDSCYPLTVPENNDLSVIHTVVAMDWDDGRNGEVTYDITDGNIGKKFSINPHTGKLSSGPLDREEIDVYNLVIVARDKGNISRHGYCNITITVKDQNDNAPHFTQSRYKITVLEDIPIYTSVLQVKATDADAGINAKITYSLGNETQGLFKINNETGIITTAGLFDREKKSTYNFEVRASDGGRYDPRTETAHVQVQIGDVNDNKPVFTHYPFIAEIPAFTQPGETILTVKAVDKDEGENSTIVYRFTNYSPHFQIDLNSGVVRATSSLAMESGKRFHLDVVAEDKGVPPQNSTGLVQIHVGKSHDVTTLRFTQEYYRERIPENAAAGSEVVKVSAVRSDGRRQKITYSFGSGNEDSAFEINFNNGLIRVRDSSKLDYEFNPTLRLIIVAQAEADGNTPLYGYTTVWLDLLDMNDNAPQFTQETYVSSVWEGDNKGTYVMQVSATDEDTGHNANVAYTIVDGNYDNAFIIEPAFSGLVKTNIVLDREIRESYKLTIIATDEGSPQLTGTCTVRINIVDSNDNQPTFPPHSVVSVSESSKVGSVITTITANDVDTNPALTYDFVNGGNPNSMFSIDRFSGKITLAQQLDHERQNSYRLRVQASDTVHTALTNITVNVIDENDNAPVFRQPSYKVALRELTTPGQPVITISATDADEGRNAVILYSMEKNVVDSFYINAKSGTIYTNRTVEYDPLNPTIQLVVTARDQGEPPLSSVVAVMFHVVDINDNAPRFSQQKYSTNLSENAPRGTTVLTLTATDMDESRNNRNIDYTILDGNYAGTFQIVSNTGEVILVKEVDREAMSVYRLVVLARDRGFPVKNATTQLTIHITDINDHRPHFNQSQYEVHIPENAAIGTVVLQISATDKDADENGEINYDITSGNDHSMFSMNAHTGVITLKQKLDYDIIQEYRFIVRATDGSKTHPLSAITTVNIKVEDVNDNKPYFPVPMYQEFIEENTRIGTAIFTAHAIDRDKGAYGKLNYSIVEQSAQELFAIDSESGVVRSREVFDFETENKFYFTLLASDIDGQNASVPVQINVESQDEYTPNFLEPIYNFNIPDDADVGFVIGQVEAMDRDAGSDGRVWYKFQKQNYFFKLNKTTGVITLKSFSHRKHEIEESFIVIAHSGKPDSKTGSARVVMAFHPLFNPSTSAKAGGIADWALGLLIALILLVLIFGIAFVFIHFRNRRHGSKATMPDPPPFESSFDTIDIRGPSTNRTDISHFPPRYNDIPHYDPTRRNHHHGNTTSEMSEQSHSASSGRGSAEDGEDVEDEEIRMINEGPLMQQQKLRERLGMPDSGIHGDDDNLSDGSVHNTQEYLARLGIDTSRSESNKGSQDIGHSMDSMHMFDEEGGGEGDGMDISNLIYTKLNEVGSEDSDALLDGSRAFGFGDEGQPSMTGSLSSIVHSEEELQGSYNWDYLLDWGPQYQPLAHVFSEIARLKDDSAPNSYSSNPLKKTLNPQVKTVPPPLLTNIAPRSIAPVALNSGHTSQIASLPSLPRSPISHESSFTSPAMSPSFSPSLSPLATRSPSISPLMTPGGPQTIAAINHARSARSAVLMPGASSGSENELHI